MSISDLEFRKWLTDLKIGIYFMGRLFGEALKGKAFVILKSKTEVIISEIKEDGSRGKIVTSDLSTEDLTQIEACGEHGNILICLDKKKKVILSCRIKNDFTVEVLERFNPSSEMHFRDHISAVIVSPCGKYVFVHIHDFLYKGAKQLVLSVHGKEIKLCAVLDLASEEINYFLYSLAYLKTVGDELIFKCITRSVPSPSTMVTFVYNKKTKELKELKNHRKIIEDHYFVKFSRHENTLYSIGKESCRLLKIT